MNHHLNILDIIEQNRPRLSTKERGLADYIIKNRSSIQNINIQDLAKLTHSSASTITRFCKKLECKNFVEFKIRLGQEHHFVSEGETVFDTVKRYYFDVIHSMIGMLNPQDIEVVVKKISQASRLFIYGIGSSGVTAVEFKYRLMRMGLQIDAIADPHMMLMNSSLVSEKDVVIVLSNTGMTQEIIDAVREAKRQEARIISVTNHNYTPLTELSDHVVFTSGDKTLNQNGFVNNQLPILFVLDLISNQLLKQEGLRKNRQKTLRVLSEHKKI